MALKCIAPDWADVSGTHRLAPMAGIAEERITRPIQVRPFL
jgi:hypothetical protein